LSNAKPDPDPGKTQSLMMRIVDMHILHVHPLATREEFFITATICYQEGGQEYPATFVLPGERVALWRMEAGDTFSVVNQKVRSQHHLRKEAEKRKTQTSAAPKRKRAA
jgi:hypothetical protein